MSRLRCLLVVMLPLVMFAPPLQAAGGDTDVPVILKLAMEPGANERPQNTANQPLQAYPDPSPACQAWKDRPGKTDDFDAELTELVGEILVYQGAKYLPAREGLRVRDGDRLMVMNQSTVTVVYDEGCRETYKNPEVVSVDGCLCLLALRKLDDPGLSNRLRNTAFSAAAIIKLLSNDDDDNDVGRAVSP